ncbi:hypothetical protein MyNCGM121_54180 [Achromobacter xylosoxidans]
MSGINAAIEPNPAEDAKHFISALRDRCSWPIFREALKRARLSTGLGWVELEGTAAETTTNGAKLRQLLREYYFEHLIAGERYIQLYEMPAIDKKRLLTALGLATVPKSDFQDTYPLPLSLKRLPSAPSDPTLVEVRPLDRDDYALVYCSVRSYDDREKYTFNQLPSHVQQTYTEIDQLITVRKVHYQAYDVVVIRPGLNRIEICIDQPKKSNTERLELAVLSVLRTACQNVPDLEPAFSTPAYNVFPAISGIYFTHKEGTVRSLSFRTLTGSRKHERMIQSDDDLRAEKFHQAGAHAVQNKLKPYELTVEWESKVPEGKFEVTMKALIRELSSQEPRLYGFYVTANSNPLLAVAINKIIKYI